MPAATAAAVKAMPVATAFGQPTNTDAAVPAATPIPATPSRGLILCVPGYAVGIGPPLVAPLNPGRSRQCLLSVILQGRNHRKQFQFQLRSTRA